MKRIVWFLVTLPLVAGLSALLVFIWLAAADWSFETKPPMGPLSQDEIVAEIERNRGSYVDYDEERPGRPVVGVRLSIGCSADILLQYVKGLTRLKTLSLRHTSVTDAGLREVQNLTHLEKLELSRTKITDSGLPHLGGLTELKYLDLSETNVTGAGFAWLQELEDLEELSLFDTQITDADLRYLAQYLKGLPNLEYVRIGYNPQVTERALNELRKALPNVRVK